MLVKPIGPLEVNDLDSKFTIIFEKYTISTIGSLKYLERQSVRGCVINSLNVSVLEIVIYFHASDEILEIFFSIFDFQKNMVVRVGPNY